MESPVVWPEVETPVEGTRPPVVEEASSIPVVDAAVDDVALAVDIPVINDF